MSVAPLRSTEETTELDEETTEEAQALPPQTVTSSRYSLISEDRLKALGQNYNNPCCCFAWLCRGTCSLRTGCYVVGGIQLAFGLIILVVSILFPKPQTSKINIAGVVLAIIANIKEDADTLAMVILTFTVLCAAGGMMLVLSARWLSKKYARAATATLSCAALLTFAMGILLHRIYNKLETKDPETDYNLRKQLEKDQFIILGILWVGFVLPLCIFMTYSAMCAYAMLSQLLHGEYANIVPQQWWQDGLFKGGTGTFFKKGPKPAKTPNKGKSEMVVLSQPSPDIVDMEPAPQDPQVLEGKPPEEKA